MRLNRLSWLMPAVLASLVGACKHDDPVEIISRDGKDSIPIIDLSPGAAAGFLGGTRVTNQFLLTSFDTAVVDAFGRGTSNPPFYMVDPNGFYGATPLFFGAGAAVATSSPVQRLLPALVGTALTYSPYGTAYTITYIVPGGHPGNGTGNTSWEFWYVLRDLTAGQRYIMALVRYALVQRGALDWSELLQTGTVTQPDSLVFRAGDFNPGGNKANDNGFIVDCSDPTEGRPVDRANPYYVAGKTASTTASRRIIIDHTVCSDASTVWSNGFGGPRSPVGPNNAPPINNQYNFLEVWEAKADSTPDYTRPVYREQIGPLLTTTGRLVNNSYGPIPTAALTSAQLVLRPGGVGRADSVKLTANNLVPLASGAYQVWVVRSGTSTAQKVTGRVIRLRGATVVDTLPNVSEFNVTSTMDGARVEFDFGPLAAVAPYDVATFAVAGTAGATTLSTSQPLWGGIQKTAGTPAALSSALTFGSFNSGTGTTRFGAAGSSTGGLFGLELREDVKRLPRPPIGYVYQAWLTNTGVPAAADTTKRFNVGTILTPYPDLQPLTDADTRQTAPLAGVEITQAAIRHLAGSLTFFCDYDRVQVRLTPKNGTAALPPTVVLSGTNPRKGCP